MTARSKARRRALDVLFEADQRELSLLDVLEQARLRREQPLNPYTEELVVGVAEHLPEIDARLGERAERWPVGRLPAVDRAALRLATYELLWRSDVPPAVVIDEAVEMVKDLSTDESPAFVNGVLAALLADRGAGPRTGSATPPPHRVSGSAAGSRPAQPDTSGEAAPVSGSAAGDRPAPPDTT